MYLTKEQRKISDSNRKKAAKYFGIGKGMTLHHKDESLRHENVDRYIEWRIEDLIPMTTSEHRRYHMLNMSDEFRNNLSEAHIGVKLSKEHSEKIGKSHMKKVLCVDTGVIYNSLKEAKMANNLTTIGRCCNGYVKKAGGKSWQWI